MSDQEIIKNLFDTKSGFINRNKMRLTWLDKHKDIKDYLRKRYPNDEFISYRFNAYRILYKIENLNICKMCGKKIYKLEDHIWCSLKCMMKDSSFYKVGSETRIKHGKKNPEWKKSVFEKVKKTIAERHPDDPTAGRFGSKANKESIMRHYGVDNCQKVKSIHQQSIECAKKKCPEDPYNSKSMIYTKRKNSENCPNYFLNISKKIRESALKNGHKCYGRNAMYIYDNLHFDSKLEIVFYLYAVYNNQSIIYEPISWNYIRNGKPATYTPDFLYEGEYIDTKGDHFFDEQGNLINPYTKDYFKRLDKDKENCMKSHNVKLVKEKDMKYMFDFLISHNIDYKQYKIKKEK